MVDLPKVSDAVVTSEAPVSRLSGADVAAPYQQLASALDKSGDALNDIAVTAAEDAGRQAVTKDADGKLSIASMPIFGKAGEAYSRAANMTYLAQAEPEIENKATEIRLAHANDPAGFQAAWDAFSTKVKSTAPNPALSTALSSVMAREGGQNYRATLISTDTASRANALISLQSRLSDINERGASLARQGGTDTPEYAALHADRQAIYRELTADPRFQYPAERAGLEEKQTRDQDVAQAIIGHGVRDFQTRKNLPEAQQFFQRAFWGPGSESLHLTRQQRDAGVAEGLSALERIGAQAKADQTAFQETVQGYTKNLQAAPATFDPIAHNTMVARAVALGDVKTKAELDAARTMVPLWQSLHGLTPAQGNAVVADMARGVVPVVPTRLSNAALDKLVQDEAAAKGISPDLAKRIVMLESSGDAAAVKGSHKGLMQLSDAEFARYGQGDIMDPGANVRAGIASLADKAAAFKSKYGRDPTVTEIYLAHQQGEGGLAAHLASPDAPAWRNMLSTAEGQQKGEAWAKQAIWQNVPDDMKRMFPGGVDTVTSRQFMNVWAEKVQGVPLGGAMVAGHSIFDVPNPYVGKLFMSTVAQMREAQGKNADQLADFIVNQAKDRNAVTPDTMQTFVTAAVGSGKEALFQKVTPALEAYDTWKASQGGLGLSSTGVITAQIGAAKASGVDPVHSAVLTNLNKMVQDGAANLDKDPITEASRRGWIKPPNDLNLGDPQKLATELASRNSQVGTIRQIEPALGPRNVLSPDEAEAMRTALTQGDPKMAGALIGSLNQSLSPENFKATMATDPMKAALSGMIRSRDPERMTAGMSALDNLWRADPWGFKATYGADALTHLQAWQGLKDTFTAPEIAERLNKSDDPGMASARAQLKTMAEDETKSWTPAAVAYQLGTSWGIPILSRIANPVTGATPDVPFDPIAQGALLHDYDSTYTALRTYGVDADKAKELATARVKSEWGPSSIAGGQLMKNPPDAYYKPINGSLNWMREDLQRLITSVRGPQVTTEFEGTPEARSTGHWTLKGLVADPQTQAEIAAGKPPSYMVALDTGTGLTEFLIDPSTGKPGRIAWNRDDHLAEAQAKFQALDDQRKLERTMMDAAPLAAPP